jgi:hypothetical protein
VVKHEVEQHVSSKIVEARAATLKALKEVERDWQRAVDKIAERAAQTKAPGATRRCFDVRQDLILAGDELECEGCEKAGGACLSFRKPKLICAAAGRPMRQLMTNLERI